MLNKKTQAVIAVVISMIAFTAFLFQTQLISNSILLAIISLVVIYPFIGTSKITKHLFIVVSIVCIAWIAVGLGSTLFPFIIAILVGYLLDPLVTYLERRYRLPRYISAIIAILLFTVILVTGAIFVVPIIIEQAQNIVNGLSHYVNEISQYIRSEEFYALLDKFNLEQVTIENTIRDEILPRLESIISTVFDSLLALFLGFSDLATHIVNLVITPILTFYFLKDFGKFKSKLNWIVKEESEKAYYYLNRFDSVLRIYIGWQITAALIVFTVSSIVFSIFDLPYGVLIAAIAGLLNPIPYFGSIFSLLIGSSILLLVNESSVILQIVILISTIAGVHFLNAYLLEPAIAGNRVGLHPIIMILSVFIFFSLFGIIGMLIAVPITAIIALVIQDKVKEYMQKKIVKSIENNEENEEKKENEEISM
jgi:predicted PurR-regulated permease PerM